MGVFGKGKGKKQKLVLSPELAALRPVLIETSGTLMRQFLLYKGLSSPQSASAEKYADTVLSHVDSGALSIGDVREFLVDASEHGSKHVYLYRVDPDELKGWKAPHGAPSIKHLDQAQIHRSPRAQHFNYVYATSDRIRISVSEMHKDLVFDESVQDYVPVDRFCVIVAEVDRTSGEIALLLDTPGRLNSHGTRLKYFTHFRAALPVWLDASVHSVALHGALKALQDDDRIRIVYSRLDTSDLKVSAAARTVVDIRQSADWEEMKASRTAFDEDEFVWLPQGNAKQGTVSVPMREIRTRIVAPAGEIRFKKHTLGCEVEYVLGILRENA